MRETYIDEHVYKHGLTDEDIVHAWEHRLRTQFRDAPHEGELLVIGYDRKGRCIELIAAEHENRTDIYHAIRPPTTSVLEEMGLTRRKR